ncbi:tyrosine-type recombinase/integrase [Salinispora arenicola]|uniref:tyrosine-type recombinase/integrase n=1 Tax=Salinispora arenicola TaxID=168697 RepID=UPI000486712D|nr:site-specific integrase [Salinispora arenicola]
MASIEKHGPSYRVVWRYQGRKQRTTWSIEELALDAKAIVEGYRGNRTAEQVYIDMGVIDPDIGPTVPTFEEYAQKWLPAKTGITPGTRAGYKAQLENRIFPAFGKRRMDQITATDIGTLLNHLHDPDEDDEPGLKNTTVTRYFALINQIFEAAVRDKFIIDNPAEGVRYKRDQVEHDDTGEPTQIRLAPAEYKILLRAFDPEDRPLVELLAATGARWSEATALSVAHVRPATEPGAKDRIRIWRAWKRDGKGGWYLGTTKGRRRRDVPVRASLMTTLKSRLADRPDDAFLITAPGGGPVHYSNFLQRRWNPALARAMRCAEHPLADRGGPREEPGRRRCRDYGGTNDRGKPCGAITAAGMTRCHDHMGPAPDAVSTCDCLGVLRRRPTPHDLRHTHAAWLFSDRRMTPLAISRRLGHAQLSTTSEIYGDLMPEAEEAAVDALDDLLNDDQG